MSLREFVCVGVRVCLCMCRCVQAWKAGKEYVETAHH